MQISPPTSGARHTAFNRHLLLLPAAVLGALGIYWASNVDSFTRSQPPQSAPEMHSEGLMYVPAPFPDELDMGTLQDFLEGG